MKLTSPPSPPSPSSIKVFLAGSIEMGAAPDWQAEFAAAVADLDVEVLNPRRVDWDSSWTQSIDDPQFRGQVEWELEGLAAADVVVFFFAGATKSPITLLELGILAGSNPAKTVVFCPSEFWRKGNVDVVCARFGVAQVSSMAELTTEARRRLGAAASRRA